MFRVSLANAFAKRSLRPLHEKHQATPVQVLLDATVTEVYSGQVAELNADGTVKKFDGTGTPWGLFALDKNATIDDTNGQPTDLGSATNGTPFAIWQGGPDAYFRVTDPGGNEVIAANAAFDEGAAVFAIADGKLDDSGTNANIVGTVVEVIDAASDIVIQVLVPNRTHS